MMIPLTGRSLEVNYEPAPGAHACCAWGFGMAKVDSRCPPGLAGAVQYTDLGCFNDDEGQRALPVLVSADQLGQVVPDTASCARLAYSKAFRYFGLEMAGRE